MAMDIVGGGGRGCCVASAVLLVVCAVWILFLSHNMCAVAPPDQQGAGAQLLLRGATAAEEAGEGAAGGGGEASKPRNPNFLSDEAYFTVMSSMPIPTVDVLLVDRKHTKTLLFKRSNKPVQGIYYSLGGRIYKNERVEDAAARKLQEEIGITCQHPLAFAGMVQEVFEDSMFDGSNPEHPDWVTNSHCYNTVFYCEVHPELLASKMTFDGQHDDYKWFPTNSDELHPLMREKITLVKQHQQKQPPRQSGGGGAPRPSGET